MKISLQSCMIRLTRNRNKFLFYYKVVYTFSIYLHLKGDRRGFSISLDNSFSTKNPIAFFKNSFFPLQWVNEEQFNRHISTMNINRSKQDGLHTGMLGVNSRAQETIKGQFVLQWWANSETKIILPHPKQQLCPEMKSQLSDKLQEEQLVTFNIRLNIQSISL